MEVALAIVCVFVVLFKVFHKKKHDHEDKEDSELKEVKGSTIVWH